MSQDHKQATGRLSSAQSLPSPPPPPNTPAHHAPICAVSFHISTSLYQPQEIRNPLPTRKTKNTISSSAYVSVAWSTQSLLLLRPRASTTASSTGSSTTASPASTASSWFSTSLQHATWSLCGSTHASSLEMYSSRLYQARWCRISTMKWMD